MIRKKEHFDWNTFHWIEALIGLFIFGSIIISIIKNTKSVISKESAVVIEIVKDNPFNRYKVKFLMDRTVRMENLDYGINVGDTVLLKK